MIQLYGYFIQSLPTLSLSLFFIITTITEDTIREMYDEEKFSDKLLFKRVCVYLSEKLYIRDIDSDLLRK